MATFMFSAATCSWIDPVADLLEKDTPITQNTNSRNFIVGNSGYRYVNFIETWIELAPGGQSISSSGFSPASGINRGPSFAGIAAHVFPTQRKVFQSDDDMVTFTQVCGARTVSPEVIGTVGGGLVGGGLGGAAGGFIFGSLPGAVLGAGIGAFGGIGTGDVVLHQIKGLPPIWSKLQIKMYRNGKVQAMLLQHSLFPSLTTYVQTNIPADKASYDPGTDYHRVNHPNGQSYYNATRDTQLPDWQANGWGLAKNYSTLGAFPGNPWAIDKGWSGGRDDIPN